MSRIAAVTIVSAALAGACPPALAQRVPVIIGGMGMNILIETDGTVKSWGGSGGEAADLGDGTDRTREIPAPVPGLPPIVDGSVGFGHVLLVAADGTVYGWGRNNHCELGVKDDHRRRTPMVIPGVSGAVQVVAGREFSAALLRDGTVRTWGSNDDGLLGIGKTAKELDCSYTPVVVEGLSGVKRLVASEAGNVLALKQDGTVWGWGANKGGILCDGPTENRTRPVQMKGIADAVDMDISEHAAIVLADGTVRMCGPANDGAMADGGKGIRSTPWKVAGVGNAVAVKTNNGATLVRLKDGTLLGWGYSLFGSLGDGRVDHVDAHPHPPIGLGPVLAHYWASNSGFAVRADGTIMQWQVHVGNDWVTKPSPFIQVRMDGQIQARAEAPAQPQEQAPPPSPAAAQQAEPPPPQASTPGTPQQEVQKVQETVDTLNQGLRSLRGLFGK